MDQDLAPAVDQAARALLADPGVRLEHEQVRQLVLRAGATPGLDAGVVRLPGQLIDECVARCPHTVELADQRGRTVTLTPGGPPSHWSCPGMYWQDGAGRRPFTRADMAAVGRLLDRLPEVDVVFGMALDDVPPAARDVVGLAAMAAHCGKHLRVLCFSPAGAALLPEMHAVGGPHPWFSLGFTAHGPLRWTHLALEVFRATAGHGLPVSVNGEPMAGASGPVTLAGAAAVGTAEILAGLVVNQLLEPGRPCLFNLGLAHVLDMRTAVAVTGGPENAMLAALSAQLGRFYGLPSASWVSTESLTCDAQAGLEKMFGFHTHRASGVSAIWGVGQLESELTFSPGQAVIDAEMIAYAAHYARGVSADAESLAVAVARRVGIAGSYLDDEHTLAHFRTSLFQPRLLWRQRRGVGEGAGAGWADLAARADARAAALMAEPPASALAADQLAALDRMAADLAARCG